MRQVEPRPEYAEVPDGRGIAERDPHWDALARPGTLPAAYLPPAVARQQTGWRRAAVWLLVALLVSATSGGVCLTYGPGELFRLLAR